MSNKDLSRLAERIVNLLEEEPDRPDPFSLQTSIEKINNRLEVLEEEFRTHRSNPQMSFQQPAHPSKARFDSIEEIANEIADRFENKKACTFEPNDKPCDNCSMCSTLGF